MLPPPRPIQELYSVTCAALQTAADAGKLTEQGLRQLLNGEKSLGDLAPEAGKLLPSPVELIAFSEEEGVR